LERSFFNRNPGFWFFKKTGLNRHRGVLSEEWAKKRVAKILVLSNDHADISFDNFQRCTKIIATGQTLPK